MPIYQSSALRKGRFSQPGGIYIITCVTHERKTLFTDWFTGRLVMQEFRHVQQAGLADTLCWVVMPDHFHWLLQLQQAELPSVLQRVKARSARNLNQHLHRRGRLWQAGYHDHALRAEQDLLGIARYIVANPIRAGLVKRVADYPLWDARWLR